MHDARTTARTIATELGAAGERWLASVDPTLVGSGCIAQVHRAVGADGARLAVKVLHPGVEAVVGADLCLLRAAAWAVEALVPLPGLRWLALREAVDEFARFMAMQAPRYLPISPYISPYLPISAYISLYLWRCRRRAARARAAPWPPTGALVLQPYVARPAPEPWPCTGARAEPRAHTHTAPHHTHTTPHRLPTTSTPPPHHLATTSPPPPPHHGGSSTCARRLRTCSPSGATSRRCPPARTHTSRGRSPSKASCRAASSSRAGRRVRYLPPLPRTGRRVSYLPPAPNWAEG